MIRTPSSVGLVPGTLVSRVGITRAPCRDHSFQRRYGLLLACTKFSDFCSNKYLLKKVTGTLYFGILYFVVEGNGRQWDASLVPRPHPPVGVWSRHETNGTRAIAHVTFHPPRTIKKAKAWDRGYSRGALLLLREGVATPQHWYRAGRVQISASVLAKFVNLK